MYFWIFKKRTKSVFCRMFFVYIHHIYITLNLDFILSFFLYFPPSLYIHFSLTLYLFRYISANFPIYHSVSITLSFISLYLNLLSFYFSIPLFWVFLDHWGLLVKTDLFASFLWKVNIPKEQCVFLLKPQL